MADCGSDGLDGARDSLSSRAAAKRLPASITFTNVIIAEMRSTGIAPFEGIAPFGGHARNVCSCANYTPKATVGFAALRLHWRNDSFSRYPIRSPPLRSPPAAAVRSGQAEGPGWVRKKIPFPFGSPARDHGKHMISVTGAGAPRKTG